MIKNEGEIQAQGVYEKSFENKPLITIITVVFNGEKYLEQTIQSVINQTYDNVEYIIIDGGSTDGTIDIIKQYEDQIDYWMSEKDNGVYDAMNKGISLCHGKYIGIINSDDYYNVNTVKKVVESFENYHTDIVYGDIMIHKKKQNPVLVHAHAIGLKNKFFPYSMHWLLVEMIFPHPSMFASMALYKRYGLYDSTYRIAADYKFVLYAYKNNTKFYYLKEALSHFRIGGISTSVEKGSLDEEMNKARKEVYGIVLGFLLNKMIFLLLSIKSSLRIYHD